jgi:carbon storage regulator
MLLLSRRVNQKIVLPDLGITITVVAIKGGAVRIGIEAPPQVRVSREEILQHHDTPVPHPTIRRGEWVGSF